MDNSSTIIHLFSFPTIIKKELVCGFLFLLILSASIYFFDVIGPILTLPFFRLQLLSKNFKTVECDYSYGQWVRDVSYKQPYNDSCPFLDPGFRCTFSGRKDFEYLNWRWQPHSCDLPRFNARDLLERGRNGRIAFAGDSIGRNQWESFLCLLAQGVSNISTIREINGSPITKHKGFLSMHFGEYNLTVEYYREPLLVFMGRATDPSSGINKTIRVNQLHWRALQWERADVLVFNTGHWWNLDKTVKQGFYFEDGGKVNRSMDVEEAFRRSLQTWKSWALKKLSPNKNHVFFCSYSPAHYRYGTWSIGRCDVDIQPSPNFTTEQPEQTSNKLISGVMKEMKRSYKKAKLLNISYLTDFRYDGHPSVHREPGVPPDAPQDCSHWCLPGIPDTWNDILYANLLSMEFRTK